MIIIYLDLAFVDRKGLCNISHSIVQIDNLDLNIERKEYESWCYYLHWCIERYSLAIDKHC